MASAQGISDRPEDHIELYAAALQTYADEWGVWHRPGTGRLITSRLAELPLLDDTLSAVQALARRDLEDIALHATREAFRQRDGISDRHVRTWHDGLPREYD